MIELFSKSRIDPYLTPKDDAEILLSKYHSNIMLSEAMIPTLNYFEICLRNRIDNVIQKYFGTNWLINNPSNLIISKKDLDKINDITHKFLKERKIQPSHDDVVAQMTFGFWCSFFHKKYDPILWHKKDAIKMLFPYLLRSNRTRAYIEQKILKIKHVRNRIAHHEPIWNNKIPINEIYSMCQELINAMSQNAGMFLQKIDRFPRVYKELFDI